jgi:uncharacterized membrane protein
VREWIELSSQGIQDLAVVIIVVSIIFGSLRFLLQLSTRVPDPYPAYKKLLGRSLLLSLEFLIAADVIRTILLDETAKSIGILGGLVLVRTFLSWSVVVEIEGHWPWHSADVAARAEPATSDATPKTIYESMKGLDKPARWAIDVPVPAGIRDGDISCSPQGTEGQP